VHAVGSAAHASVTPLGSDIRFVNAVRWVGDVLPLASANVPRPQGDERELAYSPEGTLVASVPVSVAAIAGFCLIAAALGWWIRWNTDRLFFARADAGTTAAVPDAPDEAWTTLTTDQQMVLMQIAGERFANPWQRSTVDGLLGKGLVRLSPGLQPCSPAFERFLLQQAEDRRAELEQWEHQDVEHSWRYIRVVLVVLVAGLGCFLIATQPSLQSSVIAITTGIAGALTSAMKLRDAVGAWLASRKAS
jgi:hypothetical protein